MSAHRKTIFQQGQVQVVDEGSFRYLQFGDGGDNTLYQSIIAPSQPGVIPSPTVRRMCLAACMAETSTLTALVLGLGGGVAARALRDAGFAVCAIENDPDVLAALPCMGGADGIQVIEGDAMDHLAGHSVDAILVNLFTEDGMADCLTRGSFWREARSILAPAGVMAVNLLTGLDLQREAQVMAARTFLDDLLAELWWIPDTYNQVAAYALDPRVRARLSLV